MKTVLTTLANSVLIPLGLTAAGSATDAAIQRKNFGSGTTTLIIWNKEREDIMKIVKSLRESGILVKSFSQIIKNEGKEQKSGFLGMSLGTSADVVLGSVLVDKGVWW